MNHVRVLPFGTFEPRYNMALDAVLLRRAASGQSPPTLRFYQWSRPTLSFGRSQRSLMDDLEPHSGPETFDVVLRPTGGAVAVHGRDLSYALATPFPCSFLPPRPKACYGAIHGAWAEALRRLGYEVECLPTGQRGNYREKIYCSLTLSAYDIVSGRRKVVGSAQRLSSGALLQHGFVLLDEDFGWVRRLLGPAGEDLAQASVPLSDLRPPGGRLDLEPFRRALLDALQAALGVEFQEAALSSEEQQAVEKAAIEPSE